MEPENLRLFRNFLKNSLIQEEMHNFNYDSRYIDMISDLVKSMEIPKEYSKIEKMVNDHKPSSKKLKIKFEGD